MSEWIEGETACPHEEGRQLLSGGRLGEDLEEQSLRPKRLADYCGQESLKRNIAVYIEAARQRHEALDHLLLYGPPGLGKTTLAGIVAAELGVEFRVTTGPVLEKNGDLAAILTNLGPRDVLFIDEIHRLPRSVEELLYQAMEDYQLDIMIGTGPGARSLRLDLEPFTLIGATTRAGLLSAPLRDRFGVLARLELYKPHELEAILARDAEILGLEAAPEGLAEIALRSRGTPRIAIRLLKRLRDFAQVLGDGCVDRRCAVEGLAALEIDALGLDAVDRRMLGSMARDFRGGPVGLDTLAAMTGEDAGTIEEMLEPYLLQMALIEKTPRGRKLTAKAWRHLGLEAPQTGEGH